MADGTLFTIEVAYATQELQRIRSIGIRPGTTARQAVEQSGLAEEFSVDFAAARLGVFGRVVEDSYCPQPGDRVEIYRDLLADPREARRQRARKSGQAPGSGQ